MKPIDVHRLYINKINNRRGILVLILGRWVVLILFPLFVIAWTALGVCILTDLITILKRAVMEKSGLPIRHWQHTNCVVLVPLN
jgi:hypothetical protein